MGKTKKVTFQVVTQWTTDLPVDWDAAMCEFWANDGSWCVANMWEDLAAASDREHDPDCGCSVTHMTVTESPE